MLTGLKLPFQFDPERLKRDLLAVGTDEWSPHYNQGDYGGEWRGAALRAGAGSAHNLHAEVAENAPFADTQLLSRCPYFSEVLSLFECPLKAVRLLSLAPGAFIREHTDNALDYEDGEIRIHIPIQTNSGVEFYVCGERLQLDEGGCYYINVNLPHRVNNRGAAARIHLVIDAEVNQWLHVLFRRGAAEGWRIPRSPLPPRSFEEFRVVVLETPALRESLRAVADRTQFVASAIELGRDRGFEFNEGDVDAGIRNVQSADITDLSGWMPIKVYLRDSHPFAEWIYTAGRPFTEPFFHESVQTAMREPFAALSRCEMPLDAAARLTPKAPAGFIFHISRCGSTLAAQMLNTLPGAHVISEPGPLDDVIQIGRLQEAERAQRLRWVVTALGRRNNSDNSRYFIKLDSWHIHEMRLIRAAFPETPWIFLHRDPSEVVASQLRSPGMLGAAGAMDPHALRLTFEDIITHSREQWCQRVIADFLAAAETFRDDPKGLFVDYSEMPAAVWRRIAPHFGVSLSADDVARMRNAAQYDAKNPAMTFPPISAAG